MTESCADSQFRCGHPRTPENSAPKGRGEVRCRECHSKRSRLRYEENREKEAERKRHYRKDNRERVLERERTRLAGGHRERNLKRYYGMTPTDYKTILAAQDGRCAICDTDDPAPHPNFCVDHDHDTGRVRGLLCNACNVGLGRFKDSPELVRKAAAYLERA